jgi:hypothetical protein
MRVRKLSGFCDAQKMNNTHQLTGQEALEQGVFYGVVLLWMTALAGHALFTSCRSQQTTQNRPVATADVLTQL